VIVTLFLGHFKDFFIHFSVETPIYIYSLITMSTIPKAKSCQIVDLTVTPEQWDSYPTLDRTHINQCNFSGLTASTRVERSRLTKTYLHSDSSGKSRIGRSTFTDCDVQQVIIERSEIESSVLNGVTIERSKIRGATLSCPQMKIERSVLENCNVKGNGKIERSGIKASLVKDSKVVRSNVTSSYVTKTIIERGNIDNCDIGDCKIQRTDFQGMYLRNGIWERNNLVGRLDKSKEVIIKRTEEMPTEEKRELLASSTGAPGPSWNPDVKTNPQITPDNDTRGEGSSASLAIASPPSYAAATSILDKEISEPIGDNYDGPDIQSLPPYDEINPRAGPS